MKKGFKSTVRIKDQFDGMTEIQSSKYAQRGPMKNKKGVYSGDRRRHVVKHTS